MKHGTLPFLVTVSIMFNVFLDTYLKIFFSSFPLKKVKTTIKRNDWITIGTKRPIANIYNNFIKHVETVITLA
jgi:hypothetical protein